MSDLRPPDVTLGDLLRTLSRYRWRWMVTAAVVGGLVAVGVVFSPSIWEASQALTVRDVASPQLEFPGTFRHADEMKTSQETILQVAQSHDVLRGALAQVGPPADAKPTTGKETWPTEEDIDDLRSALSMTAPKGAEFGQTEIFYLKVKDRERGRALRLIETLCDGLEAALNRLRAARAESVIAELNESVALAREALSETTRRMAEIERQVGQDLIALRMLHQAPAGDSDLYRTLANAVVELNRVRVVESTQQALAELLEQAEDDPAVLLGAPRELVDARPSLSRLLQGLGETRLRVASLAGTFTERDPRLIAARREEEAVIEGIHRELEAATHGVQASAKVAAAQRESLEDQVAELRVRVDRLTGVRAEYSNLVEQVTTRRAVLAESERNLAAARSSLAAASSSSLLTRVSVPDGGTRPIGPGRTTLIAAGLVGGVFLGIGLVFLTAPIVRPDELPGDRALAEFWAEHLSAPVRHHHGEAVVTAEPHGNGHTLVK